MDHLLDVLPHATQTLDEAEGRVYGWIPGVVVEVDTKLMRVKARIGKQGDSEASDWLVPKCMGSVESLPEVGDPVGVEFMDGDPHRGSYFYFPQSTTKGRPTEAAMLGSTFIAMFNQLQSDVQAIVTGFNSHTHSGGTLGGGLTGVPGTLLFPLNTPAGSLNAGQGQASDGSVVSPKSGNQKVLSKRTRLR